MNSAISRVEIEVNSGCNRRCSYCPNATVKQKNIPMPVELFHRIIDQLSDLSFCGRISYHFYNEPLLRSDLEDLVTYAKVNLRHAKQILYTNGQYLDSRRYQTLLVSGIYHFVVTKHGSYPVSPRPSQTIQTPNDLSFTNRGGALGSIELPLSLPCYVLHDRLLIGWNGDVLLCYEDYHRETVLGNVLLNSILDIWESDNTETIRHILAAGKRGQLKPCSNCDNIKHVKRLYRSRISV